MDNNKRGSILILSLWVLEILVIFAISLGHRASINLKIARNQRDRLQSSLLANAGIQKAIAVLKSDSDPDIDSLQDAWNTGVDRGGNEILFTDIELKADSGNKFNTMIEDEERKVNINSASNEALILLLEEWLAEEQAKQLSDLIRAFRGDTTGLAQKGDSEVYKDFKRSPFSNTEELIIVLENFYKNELDYKIKAKELYNKMKGLITVFPLSDSNLTININTALEKVMSILINADVKKSGNEDADPGQLLEDIKKHRENAPFVSNDLVTELNIEEASQQTLANNLKNNIKVNSNYFRISSEGTITDTETKCRIVCVYDRSGKRFVYWHQE